MCCKALANPHETLAVAGSNFLSCCRSAVSMCAHEVALMAHVQWRSPLILGSHVLRRLASRACRIVTAFRAWLSGRGAGGPVPIKGTKELLPEHELLNHYEQHVCHCPSCSKVTTPTFLALCWSVIHRCSRLCLAAKGSFRRHKTSGGWLVSRISRYHSHTEAVSGDLIVCLPIRA